MKLPKTAKSLLRGLRPKHAPAHTHAHGRVVPPKQPLKPSQLQYHVVVSSSSMPDLAPDTTRQTRGTEWRDAATPAGTLGKRRRTDMGHTAVPIHEDEDVDIDVDDGSRAGTHREIASHSSTDPDLGLDDSLDESVSEGSEDVSDDEADEADEVDESVLEDMRRLEESFKGISRRYRLINRIGEGTFSTVYKAEQLLPEDNGASDDEEDEDCEKEDGPGDDTNFHMPPTKRRKMASSDDRPRPAVARRRPQIVALKKIYVTSSPHRIMNELELLHRLRDSPYICPLLTAFRHLDQVVAVLPYFKHLDFRLYYRDFLVNDMRHYFRSLFHALHHVHKAGILHRDIKPTNFLYDHAKRQGVLVDFGLAEREGTDWQPCLCTEARDRRKDKFLSSFAVQVLQSQPDLASTGYPKSDSRPSRRANRAGTRGFRAPEVLLKCTSQTTKIDIWSAGVILLTLLARRFPFFNSADDVDAMIEMASIFGRKKMQGVAAMHGQLFETNIETIGERGFTLEKIIIWASCREREAESDVLHAGEAQAVAFLQGLLELDAGKRWTAKEALQHPFFTDPEEDEHERADRLAQEDMEQEARRRRP